MPAALVSALLCVIAATPRESMTFSDVSSGSTALFAQGENAACLNGAFARTGQLFGGYQAQRIVVSGTLIRQHALTQAQDAAIVLYPPGNRAPIVIRPWTSNAFNEGAVQQIPTAFTGFNLLEPFDPQGSWIVRTSEAYQDGVAGAADARWTFITVTADDQATLPPGDAIDLGTPTEGQRFGPYDLFPGVVRWYRVTLPPVTPQNHAYVDIDTEGSTLLPAPGTALALFDAAGFLVAGDTTDGSGPLSQLTFGPRAGSRAAIGNGMPYNGRDGYLRGGVYYIGVGAAGAAIANNDWQMQSTTSSGGTIFLNIATGQRPVPTPPEATDLGSIGRDITIPPVEDTPWWIGPGWPLWLRFTVEEDVRHCYGRYLDLDIDYAGAGGVIDTRMAVYSDRGFKVAEDNDDGVGVSPLLSFGQASPSRTAIGNGVVRIGQDGPLAAGAYYLAVTGVPSALGDNFAVGGSIGGQAYVRLRIRGNLRVGVRPCNRADVAGLGGALGADGQNTADDLVAYLSAFFSNNVAVADVGSLGGSTLPDGAVSVDDLVVFLAAFFAPCLP